MYSLNVDAMQAFTNLIVAFAVIFVRWICLSCLCENSRLMQCTIINLAVTPLNGLYLNNKAAYAVRDRCFLIKLLYPVLVHIASLPASQS